MVSFELTSNNEIGNGQENNDMETFLQTVGYQQKEGFTACLTVFQALSDREYYIGRSWLEKPNTSRLYTSVAIEAAQQIFFFTHPRNNTAVADIARLVKVGNSLVLSN